MFYARSIGFLTIMISFLTFVDQANSQCVCWCAIDNTGYGCQVTVPNPGGRCTPPTGLRVCSNASYWRARRDLLNTLDTTAKTAGATKAGTHIIDPDLPQLQREGMDERGKRTGDAVAAAEKGLFCDPGYASS